jgi:hypothetical protein
MRAHFPPFETIQEHPRRWRTLSELCQMHGIAFDFFDAQVGAGNHPRIEMIQGRLMAELDEFEDWVQNLEGVRECS